MKKEIETFDEENLVIIESEHTIDTFNFFPEQKKFKISSSIKGDVFYNNSIIEYKISEDPIELELRTLELFHEPPIEYSIKDMVVLESEIKKNKFVMPDMIENLKKEVEWSKTPIFGNYEINLYILSKHPEIISKEDYRKFLRQSLERLKLGISSVKEAVGNDSHDLKIHDGKYGKSVWYSDSDFLEKEMNDYYALPEEKRKETNYAKKIEYVEKFNEFLFKEGSPKYVGISDSEFRNSDDLIEYVENLLDNKAIISSKSNPAVNSTTISGKAKLAIVIALSIIALSWGLWTAIGIFVLGVIIISILSK